MDQSKGYGLSKHFGSFISENCPKEAPGLLAIIIRLFQYSKLDSKETTVAHNFCCCKRGSLSPHINDLLDIFKLCFKFVPKPPSPMSLECSKKLVKQLLKFLNRILEWIRTK